MRVRVPPLASTERIIFKMEYSDLYDLEVGDLFLEESFSDIFEVVGKRFKGENDNFDIVLACNTRTGVNTEWGYNKNYSAYAPRIIPLIGN